MGTDVLKSYNSLEQELEKARSNLKGLNENIRRIIGREPQDIHLRGDRKRNHIELRRNDFNNSDRQKTRDLSPIPNKRRQQETKSVFSRLSGPPSRDDDQKPKLYSRVIRELPTRQEIVAAQGADEESRARNRRMFGSLLGTLQKFCQEESRLKKKEDMKAQIEKKLEEQERAERLRLRKERQTLFSDRKRQQLEIRKLEMKMTLLREFDVWENAKKSLLNHIRTNSKPYIYFKPKLKNDKIEKHLAECRAELEQEIEKKRTALNKEIIEIENKFKEEEQRIEDDHNNYADVNRNCHRNRSFFNGNEDYNENEQDDNDSMYESSDNEEYENRLQSKAIIKNNSSDDEQSEHTTYKLNSKIEIKKENNEIENNSPVSDGNIMQN